MHILPNQVPKQMNNLCRNMCFSCFKSKCLSPFLITYHFLGKESKEEPSKAAKKRSLFLALGRRRTTEMRLGPDGRVMIAGLVLI